MHINNTNIDSLEFIRRNFINKLIMFFLKLKSNIIFEKIFFNINHKKNK